MGQILAFPNRKRPAPVQMPSKITEDECRLLDKIKRVSDHSLDVVNAGEQSIRDFLVGRKYLGSEFSHEGHRYRVLVSLEEITDGPRTA